MSEKATAIPWLPIAIRLAILQSPAGIYNVSGPEGCTQEDQLAAVPMLTSVLFIAFTLTLAGACEVAAGRPVSNRDDAFIGYEEKAKSDERIVINTVYGEIRIRAFHDKAPKTAALVTDLARKGGGPQLNFYRHEHVPKNWGVNSFWGPPYALLQGSLAELAAQPPFENGVDIQKGNVCMIPNSREFFIATGEHPEWNRAHAVWGEVDDLVVASKIPFEPSFTRNDGTYTTTWLNSSIPFQISLRS